MMAWVVIYHADVKRDLTELGASRAQKVLTAIEERIINGEPDKSGKPLKGELAGYRRIRTGDTRIVYRISKGKVEIFIIAIGNRRDEEVYDLALKRLQ
jgi:mRNA interferase RelE/StbE